MREEAFFVIHLIPTFTMFLVLFAIVAVAIYLKRYINEKLLLVAISVLSLWVLYEMLPGALRSAFKGVIENVNNNPFPF